MNLLLKALLQYLFPSVGEPNETDDQIEADATQESGEVDADVEGGEGGDGGDAEEGSDVEVEEGSVRKVSRGQQAIIDARKRAQTAEADRTRLEAELTLARQQLSGPRPNQPPSDEQRLWDQEEKTINDPNATDWQKYAVHSNRNSRRAETTSRQALLAAEDSADQSRFERIRAERPQVFAKYKDKVETMLKNVRQAGGNTSRENLLALALGQDMLSGKMKPASKPAAGAETRQTTNGARSDVSSKSRLTDAQQRAKRLENVTI